jgi:hypothetical protein
MNAVSKARSNMRRVPAALCALGLIASFAVKADDVNNVTNVTAFNVGATLNSLISIAINVPAGQVRELAITHSFECSVSGLTDTSWFDTDILVDGVVVAPTNSDNASCTSNNTASPDGWVTASQTVFRAVGGGNHTVLVRGRVAFGTGIARVDDQSLTVVEGVATQAF